MKTLNDIKIKTLYVIEHKSMNKLNTLDLIKYIIFTGKYNLISGYFKQVFAIWQRKIKETLAKLKNSKMER